MVKVEGKLDLTAHENKPYRAPRKGKSFEKKKVEDKKKRQLPDEKFNPKAFATGRPGVAQAARRRLDRSQHNAHVPKVDKTFADEFNEPPETVVVVGPPGCGKSTLIRSLVKQYTKQNLTSVKGPITCVAGKKRRTTFVECPNNVNAMCDAARVADLVLLVVDASFGFEMETFEFLNIAKSHGFPKLIGILTHLDKLKDNKQLKKTKKALRHRFWQEICAGAKLFYFSGMEKTTYPVKEIINLNRFLAVTKLTPQQWKTTHSCVLADRMEDITDPAQVQRDPLSDRTVALYGYVRGCPMKANQRIHVPGVGDYTITQCNHLDDPCALPQVGNKKKTRHLSERDKRLYAPMADVGSLMYDQDAVYIKVDAENEAKVAELGEGVEIMRRFKEGTRAGATVDEGLQDSRIRMFDDGEEDAGADEDDEAEDFDEDADQPEHLKEKERSHTTVVDASGRLRRKVNFASQIVDERGEGDDDDETDDDDDEGYDDEALGGLVLPSDRPDKVTHNVTAKELRSLAQDDDDDEDDFFYKVGAGKGGGGAVRDMRHFDLTRDLRGVVEEDWEVEAVRENIRDLFVTGAWSEAESRGEEVGGGGDAGAAPVASKKKVPASTAAFKKKLTKTDTALETRGYESVSDDDDENPECGPMDVDGYDDEEDEEDEESEEEGDDDAMGEDEDAAQPAGAKLSKAEQLQASVRSMIPASLLGGAGAGGDADGGEEGDEAAAVNEAEKDEATLAREATIRKKIAKKKAFDEMYDLNKAEGGGKDFLDKMKEDLEEKKEKTDKQIEEATAGDVEEKIKLVGFYAGLYVRIVIEGVPAEFVTNFNPYLPLICGGLLASEDRLGVVYIRLKKHRWYPKMLKAQDPLVLSVGWRRFQTQPLFAVEDANGRNRYLKYTPLHTHCIAAVYGPVTPPNTGVICFTNASMKSEVNHFRCSATGYVMEVDHSSRIVKKLKLTGVPAKVYKNTCFVKNMFSSALEVAKFEGAKIQTVSGLRGTVKKAVAGKGGVFRAAFEDKVAKSDIVFLKTWKAVEPSKYYNPVTNLLFGEWKAMKSMTELRRERHIAVPYSADSQYREITRTKQFNTTVKVPAKLEGNLPFNQKKLRFIEKDGQSKVDAAISQETSFALEPEEQKRRDLLEKLTLVDNIKKRSQKEHRDVRFKNREKDLAKQEEKKQIRMKELKKRNAKLAEFKEAHKAKKARHN